MDRKFGLGILLQHLETVEPLSEEEISDLFDQERLLVRRRLQSALGGCGFRQ
jgi:hypothetical protein